MLSKEPFCQKWYFLFATSVNCLAQWVSKIMSSSLYKSPHAVNKVQLYGRQPCLSQKTMRWSLFCSEIDVNVVIWGFCLLMYWIKCVFEVIKVSYYNIKEDECTCSLKTESMLCNMHERLLARIVKLYFLLCFCVPQNKVSSTGSEECLKT